MTQCPQAIVLPSLVQHRVHSFSFALACIIRQVHSVFPRILSQFCSILPFSVK